MTKLIQNATRVGILLDDEDKANAALIAKVYRTSNSGAVRIALAEVAAKLKTRGGDIMYRIDGFGEPTNYQTLEQAQAYIRGLGLEWECVTLVEDSEGHVYDASDERHHVGDKIG